MFLHGRKLYILPIQLNKAMAVAHLQNYVDYDMHVAAGDSLMDYDMLMQAELAIVLRTVKYLISKEMTRR